MGSKVLRLILVGFLVAGAAACDNPAGDPDGGPRPDAGGDAGTTPDDDAGPDPVDGGGTDGGHDGGMEDPPEPRVVTLSATGHDRLYGVTHDSAGNIYATGQIATSIDADADFAMVVVKLTPEGELDATFGTGGVAQVNVAVGGTSLEVARGIVVQSTGRIVIAGAAEHDPAATLAVDREDTDIFLVGFEADGTLDTTFGTDGITRVDVNSGVAVEDTGTGMFEMTGGDTQWSLSLAASNALVVHGTTRNDGEVSPGMPRTDNDWVLLRLTADGALDTTFGGDGIVTLDLGGAGATARSASVLPDGSIIGSGYLTSSLLVTAPATTQQPVIYKVTAAGEFDATFATTDATTEPGVWHDLVVTPPLRAEAYGAALQGDRLVTMGYGPTAGAGMGTDWISLRYTADGEIDDTYGTDGITYIDVGGWGDNGRAVIVLPDDRVMGLGGGRLDPAVPPTTGMPEVDAMVAVLTTAGAPDTSFGEGGFRTYDLGGTDFFWGGSVAPDEMSVAMVGIAGAEVSGTDDDDSVIFVLPID
jgi:uncharacterized delta-60 repeat protein